MDCKNAVGRHFIEQKWEPTCCNLDFSTVLSHGPLASDIDFCWRLSLGAQAFRRLLGIAVASHSALGTSCSGSLRTAVRATARFCAPARFRSATAHNWPRLLPQRYGYVSTNDSSCGRDSRGARTPFEALRGMETWERRQESHDDGH